MELKLPTDVELEEFKDIIQSFLPGYLRVDTYISNNKDSITVLFRFVDNATVTETVKLGETTMLDKNLAVDVIVSMIDRSIANMKYHEERLEKLKSQVISKL